MTGRILARLTAALVAAFLFTGYAVAQSVNPPGCNLASGPGNAAGQIGANYSATVGSTQVTLIPAPPYGVNRTGIFIELLTASATLGLNPGGGTASTTAAGNIVVSTGASAPNNVAYINFAAMGFIPQSAITAIADSTSRAVSAWACPQ